MMATIMGVRILDLTERSPSNEEITTLPTDWADEYSGFGNEIMYRMGCKE